MAADVPRQANARIRTRPGSTTEKCPAQSSRAVIRSVRRAPTSLGFGIAMRNNTTPRVAGSADARASSPKSLSKVSRIRASRAAQARTSGSPVPGAAVVSQTTSWPADRSVDTAAPGKFSLARNRISCCAGEYLFRSQGIPRVGKTRDYVLVGYSGIVGEDIGFAPSLGHQADDEFHREPRPAHDGLAGQDLRIERDARGLGSHVGVTSFVSQEVYPIP